MSVKQDSDGAVRDGVPGEILTKRFRGQTMETTSLFDA